MSRPTSSDLTIILDRSGSMNVIAGTVIDEVNRLVEAVTADNSASTVTVVAFDSTNPSEVLVDRATAADVPVLSADNYQVGGGTPLYDAIGLGLRRVSRHQRSSASGNDAPRTIIAVITDGEENSSDLFNAVDILGMVQRRRARNWEFLYLGVGDVMCDARRLGFRVHEIQPWEPTRAGARDAFTEITGRTVAPPRRRNRRPSSRRLQSMTGSGQDAGSNYPESIPSNLNGDT